MRRNGRRSPASPGNERGLRQRPRAVWAAHRGVPGCPALLRQHGRGCGQFPVHPIWRLSEALDAATETAIAKAWVSEAYQRVCALGTRFTVPSGPWRATWPRTPFTCSRASNLIRIPLRRRVVSGRCKRDAVMIPACRDRGMNATHLRDIFMPLRGRRDDWVQPVGIRTGDVDKRAFRDDSEKYFFSSLFSRAVKSLERQGLPRPVPSRGVQPLRELSILPVASCSAFLRPVHVSFLVTLPVRFRFLPHHNWWRATDRPFAVFLHFFSDFS